MTVSENEGNYFRKTKDITLTVDDKDFEGTLVLEKLAEIDKVEDFFEAIDSDDFAKAQSLMKLADIDAQTISIVLRKMKNPDQHH